MTTVVNLKRLLDRKQWEMCNYAPVNSSAGSFTVASTLRDQYVYYLTSNAMYIYDPFEDGWMTAPAPGFTIAAGACGAFHPWGPQVAALGGSTTTIQTSLSLSRNFHNYTVRFVSGANAGTEATIRSNTVIPFSTNVITLTTPLASPVSSGDQFILMTGQVWVMASGTISSTSLKYYDIATESWGSRASNNPTTGTWGTEGRLVVTASTSSTDCLASGTSTGANTSMTLQNTNKTWMTNNWANAMVRIVSGTGAGQFRIITSNNSNTLTVASSWTVTPDSSSVYQIEGNADSVWLLGNNSTAIYRYSISAGSWTSIVPTSARGGAAVAGCSAHWINGVTNPDWSDENNTLGNGSLNGRYIFSFRGGNTVTIDAFDIALNTWQSFVPYYPQTDTIGSGTGYAYTKDYIYIMQATPAGRVLKYNIFEQRMEPCSQLWYSQGSVISGDRLFASTFTDGTTSINFLYNITQSQNNLFRMLIF